MKSINTIINFLKGSTGESAITDNTDLFEELGMTGDDFHELIDEYADKFNVDMTEYLWYFHADEEGQSTGGLFVKPPYKRVERIPVTPSMLLNFADKGKWEIDYPKVELPKKRIDIFIDQILFGLLILVFIYILIKWMIK